MRQQWRLTKTGSCAALRQRDEAPESSTCSASTSTSTQKKRETRDNTFIYSFHTEQTQVATDSGRRVWRSRVEAAESVCILNTVEDKQMTRCTQGEAFYTTTDIAQTSRRYRRQIIRARRRGEGHRRRGTKVTDGQFQSVFTILPLLSSFAP